MYSSTLGRVHAYAEVMVGMTKGKVVVFEKECAKTTHLDDNSTKVEEYRCWYFKYMNY